MIPLRAITYTFTVTLVDASDGNTLKTAPTVVGGDVKISKDGGALANLTNTPVNEPAGSALVKVILTDDEMDAERVDILFVDQSNPKEWADLHIHIQPITDLGLPGEVVADAGNTATTFKTDLISTITDFCKDQAIRFISGTLKNQTRKVAGYDGNTKFITVDSAFSTTPSTDDKFIILGKV